MVLFDGRHAEDLAGFDWPEYRVRSEHALRSTLLLSSCVAKGSDASTAQTFQVVNV